MYYLNDKGARVYTMKKIDPNNKPTFSAHPGNHIVINYSRSPRKLLSL